QFGLEGGDQVIPPLDLPPPTAAAPAAAPIALAAAGGARPRALDASEGTPLDPLRNRTYDLNSPKTVPSLTQPGRRAAP
ncbi:MAG: hypothetical protein JNK46_18205, partial [Methylobacteriaceae bacterium]|nr:hypothetical protein [Methylobacteriaceae bacterium]